MNLLVMSQEELKQAVREGGVRACVVGLGYIGLPLSVILSERGFLVTGVDKNKQVVATSRKGKTSFFEKDLDQRLGQALKQGRLAFSLDIAGSVKAADVILVTVGTPLDSDRTADTKTLEAVARDIGKELSEGKLVIIKSTVPVGGTRRIVKPILEKMSGLVAERDFGLAFIPERTVEGKALEELVSLPKIVGGLGDRSKKAARAVYSIIGEPVVPVEYLEVAETAKLFDNIYRDVNIALANELAIVCEGLGVDVTEAIRAANYKYQRTNLLKPGVGVGGSCLTKDSYIFSLNGKAAGEHSLLMRARQINDSMPRHFTGLVKDAFLEMGKQLSGSLVAVLGYAMKSGTSDTRNTPAKQVIDQLKEAGARVRLYDPLVSTETTLGEVAIANTGSIDEAVADADAVCIVTDHNEFKNLNLARIKNLINNPSALIDGRGIVNPSLAKAEGLVFRSIGHPRKPAGESL